MNPERWPEFVRAFVDEIGVRAEGVVIEVVYEAPLWRVKASCPCCKTEVFWSISAGEPLPAPERVTEPAWYAKLNDLPPRGTS